MSLITRCPACQTLFRVVPDQLRISEGWVRCGQCNEVFDASAHLFQEAQTTPHDQAPVQPVPMPPELHQPEPTWAPDPPIEPSRSAVSEPALTIDPDPEPKAEPESRPEAALEALDVDISVDMSAESGVDVVGDLTAGKQEPVAEVFSAPLTPSAPVIVAPAKRPPVFKVNTPEILRQPENEPEYPTVSFMREVEVESAWRRPLVRVVLGLTSFLLLLALGLQVGIQERDRIVALHPQARPIMEALCAPLHCQLGPLKQIESIVIDNSSFAKIRGDAYRLGLSIKNAAPIEVAMPSLELTLTDSQDQTMLRRIFSPAEFGATGSLLAAGGEWAGSLAVNAVDVGGMERITGYKIVAFYP